MRLSWNEIRVRAADFAREWADAAYEKDETQSFYNEFFDIFGVRRRTVARNSDLPVGSSPTSPCTFSLYVGVVCGVGIWLIWKDLPGTGMSVQV